MQALSSLDAFEITIHEAKLTHDTATFGKMDPFVLVMHNGREYKTKVAKDGGTTPNWGERFEIKPEG